MSVRSMLGVGASIVGLSFTGCQKPVTISEVQGFWVAQQASQEKWIKGATRCQVALRADGTFTASVPDYFMGTFDEPSGQVMSGKGRWKLQPHEVLAPHVVKLVFDEVDGKEVNWGARDLYAVGRKQGMELFFWVDEEGGWQFIFARQPGRAAQSVED